MKKIVVVVLTLLCFSPSFAQKTITVLAKGETSLEGVLPPDMLYSFSAYKDATLIRKDGTENATRINFNLFTGDILFLTPANQILVLAYPDELEEIDIEGDVWLPIEGFFGEVIESAGSVSLVRLKKTRITDTRRESGFGGMSSTTSTKSVTAFAADNRGNVALPVGEYDFETAVSFRLTTKSGRIIVANAKGYRKVFPEKKKQIKEYLKTNPVDFKSEQDHARLINWIKSMK